MSVLDDLAAKLSGNTRAEENTVVTDATTRTYIGTATTDSADGSVHISLGEDVTMPDDYDGAQGTGVEMPTTVAVKESDEVIVTTIGGSTMKAPVVTGVVGRGDEQQAQIDAAAEAAASVEGIAQEALDVAEATGQHFWSDTDGIHVTEVTEEEWGDSADPNYHSGANVLLNALGQLFRNGLNNLLAVLPSGIAIYDGNGNAAGNILAQFTASIIRLGGKFAASGRSTAKVQFFEDDSALTDLTAEHYLNTTTDPQVSHDLALSSTITDDELPDGTSRTVTGNVEVWEQIYHSGSTYSDEVMASLNGMTTNRQNNVSMGVQAIESSGASSQRIAFVTADTVRLTSGTGERAVVTDIPMSQVVDMLSKSSTTVNLSNLGSGTKTLYLERRGNVVHASMISTATAGRANSAISCGTVPSGYRPTRNEFQSGTCVSNNNLNGYYRWRVATTGAITYWCSVTDIRESQLCMTWVTNDTFPS